MDDFAKSEEDVVEFTFTVVSKGESFNVLNRGWTYSGWNFRKISATVYKRLGIGEQAENCFLK